MARPRPLPPRVPRRGCRRAARTARRCAGAGPRAPEAVVVHEDHRAGTVLGQRHPQPRLAVPGGVVEQVAQDLAEPVRVRHRAHRVDADLHGVEVSSRVRRAAATTRSSRSHSRIRSGSAPASYLDKREQVVHERLQPQDLRAHGRLGLRPHPARRVGGGQLHGGAHRGQRAAQLVAGVGDEGLLDGVGALEAGQHLVHRVTQAGELVAGDRHVHPITDGPPVDGGQLAPQELDGLEGGPDGPSDQQCRDGQHQRRGQGAGEDQSARPRPPRCGWGWPPSPPGARRRVRWRPQPRSRTGRCRSRGSRRPPWTPACPGAGCRSPIGLARASCSDAASTWSPETTWSMASPYPGPS